MIGVQVDPSELGIRIEAARRERALTLLEVEKRTGVDHSQQSRIENGEFIRASSNVQKLCKFYGLALQADDLTALRARLEKAIRSLRTRKALEAVLDAIEDAGPGKHAA